MFESVVKRNHLGYWVGGIRYPAGNIGWITNAKHTAEAALAIVQTVVDRQNLNRSTQ